MRLTMVAVFVTLLSGAVGGALAAWMLNAIVPYDKRPVWVQALIGILATATAMLVRSLWHAAGR